ncbi:chalcone isomerase family protein [Shewanella algidipiscicola]|uniref:chalcone isomerase family protein n=1 Tax=Shewanella algidipiscicola TaxID=614070 RepID=UPI000D786A16|nr:chalcone isomerase family protein [Shewanella algidipiscicola]
MFKWLAVMLLSSSVYASPIGQLEKIGAGEMSYLFWTLYRAELFASERPLSVNAGNKQVKALRIEYYKTIDKQALVEATAEQWQHLGYSPADIAQWVVPLQRIWPNVTPGDRLTLLVNQSGMSQFYLADQLIGQIDDPRFGEAFLAIWLSENTSEPKLRQQLLGLSQ